MDIIQSFANSYNNFVHYIEMKYSPLFRAIVSAIILFGGVFAWVLVTTSIYNIPVN